MKYCPHCNASVFNPSPDGERLKAQTSIVVIHKSSSVIEINCSVCKNGIELPIAATQPATLRKGRLFRPVVLRRAR